MSLISTDSVFRRLFAILITGLVILVAVFAGLNYLQGPKLSGGQVDRARVVAQPGQQLRLFANQAISAVNKTQVSLTPVAPFTVSSTGDVIAVQFGDRLLYDTDYTVRVSGVTNSFQPRSTIFEYSFRTSGAQIFYLDRASPAAGAARPDSIIRAHVRGNVRTVVYSALRIQEFARFPEALVVSVLNEDDTSSLLVVGIDSGIIERVQLPGVGTVSELHTSPLHGFIGFTFTSRSPAAFPHYANSLMTVDFNGSHLVTPVLEPSGTPLAVTNWLFLAGSTKIVAHRLDQTVLLLDAATPGSAVPLGTYSSLGRSSPDGMRIGLTDADGAFSYAFADGIRVRLPSLPIAGVMTRGGDFALIGSGDARVWEVAIPDAAAGRSQNSLVFESGHSLRVLYRTSDQVGSIEGFSVSPNGQYVAVNVIPDVAASVSDGYAIGAQSTSITTYFVDLATGVVVSGVAGFDESW